MMKIDIGQKLVLGSRKICKST